MDNHLLRPCAVFVERLNETFIPSKRYKVDADIIYPSSTSHDELSVDVLMLPNNKVKISSSSTFDELPSTSEHQEEMKPMVRIRAHQSSIDSMENESSKRSQENDSYLFNPTLDSDDELGMDLIDEELASMHRALDFDDDDDMSNFDDDQPTLNESDGPGYHQVQLPDLVMGALRADGEEKCEPAFQYSDLFNRKGRTFVCDERGNRVVSVKLDKNSAKRLTEAIERNLGRLVLEECRRGDLQAHILKVKTDKSFISLISPPPPLFFRLFLKMNKKSLISIVQRLCPNIRLNNVQKCIHVFSKVSLNLIPMNKIRWDPMISILWFIPIHVKFKNVVKPFLIELKH